MRGIRWGVLIEGLNLERLIRLCAENSMPLHKLKRKGNKIVTDVDEADLPALQEIANRGGWKMIRVERKGIGKYLFLLKKHPAFMIACAAMVISVFLGAQLLWSINIVNGGIYETDILRYLNTMDIHPLTWKNNIVLDDLRSALEWRYPEVAWIDCGWRGSTLRIEFIQGTTSKESTDTGKCADIVASRSGIIESIIVKAGTPQVKAGEIIQAGDLLIAGQERGKDEGVLPVKAQGVVLARVWDCASVRIPVVQWQTEYTGEQDSQVYIRCPWFNLREPEPCQFDTADLNRRKLTLGGLFFPFEIVMETAYETSYKSILLSDTEAKSIADQAVLRQLYEKTGFEHELVDKWVDYCMIEDEILEAVAYGERIIDVAISQDNEP